MSARTFPVAKFRLGRILSTPHALESLTQEDILVGIQRHQAGDWGNESAEDRQANDRALVEGTRIFSAYRDRKSTRLNSSHLVISYAVFCLKKKTKEKT